MKNTSTRLLWFLRYTLGFLPFFAVATSALYVAKGVSWWTAAVWMGMYFLPGLVLGVGAWRFANWCANLRHHWGRFFGLHLLGGFVYSVVWHVTFLGLLYVTAGQAVVRANLNSQLLWWLLTGLMVYAVLIGMASIHRLVEQLRERELNAVKSESLRVRAEMEILRGQLDPHFLFNTLHSITALVREDPKRAEEALLQFGDLLRQVIDTKRDGADEVPLSEELAFIDRYLALEKLRLDDRLIVQRAYSPAALDCWLPVFTVQPLVENAIRHAIAPHREGGTLKLFAQVRDNSLEIVVEDNGPGADPVAVAKSSGVGLGAIRQRLKLRHCGAATLKIDTSPGRGFCVTISLPAVQNAIVDTVI